MRTFLILLLASLALLALPALACAADVPASAEPEAISDPPSAFDGEAAVIDLGALEPDVATASAAKPAASSSRGGGAVAPARVNTAPTAAPKPTSGAELPFTGVASDLSLALAMLGILLLAGGITVMALPSSRVVHASE